MVGSKKVDRSDTIPPEAPISPKAGYHHGDLKAQLIAAVRQLVEERGPDGFSISEASRRAGVSTAAPYKHFKDRPAILKAVVIDGMFRLEARMREAIEDLPRASLARVDAIGKAYVDFAREEPGVFRLVFGLTEDHEGDAELIAHGKQCFGVILQAVADYLGLPADEPVVLSRGYTLWTFVHGHSFLLIDRKAHKMAMDVEDTGYFSAISSAILGGRSARHTGQTDAGQTGTG